MEWLIIIALLVFIFWICVKAGFITVRMPGRKTSGGTQLTDEARMKLLELRADKALRDLHCEAEWTDEKEGRSAKFDYQNGHFHLYVDKESSFARLSYFFCYNTSIDNLNNVRMVCNQCNIHSEVQRIVYSVNEVKNEVDLHIFTGLSLDADTAKDVLAEAMAGVFSWQNSFVRRIRELTEDGKNNDVEAENAAEQRHRFLLSQQEMRLQDAEMPRLNDTEHLRLDDLVEKMMGITGFKATRATISPKDMTLTDSDEIHALDVWEVFRERTDSTVILLWFDDPANPGKERLLNLTLNGEGSDGQTDYFRATGYVVPLTVRPGNSFRQQQIMAKANSVLLAHDNVSRQKQVDESNYMWKEAVQKLRNNEADSLSDEQKLLAFCTDMPVAQLIYEGKKLYRAQRYYEALLRLENAYAVVQKDYDSMKETQREGFFDLIYDIGFCYHELHQYKMALAYLDMLTPLHRISFTMEQVNTMVNSRDWRSMMVIDNLEQNIKDSLQMEDEEPKEHIRHFLAFLQRRKVYVMIDKQQYEQAKTLLNEMLSDSENADFAINELAYLQKIEKEDKTE